MKNILALVLMISSLAFAAPAIIGGKDGAQFISPLIVKQSSTPSTPASGYHKLYFKSDGFLYQKNAAGVESQIGLDFSDEIQDLQDAIDNIDLSGLANLSLSNLTAPTAMNQDLTFNTGADAVLKTNDVESGTANSINVFPGNATTGYGGTIWLRSGSATEAGGLGGGLALYGGDSVDQGAGGVFLVAGDSDSGGGGSFNMYAGDSNTANGGAVNIYSGGSNSGNSGRLELGTAWTDDGTAGNIILVPGQSVNTSNHGKIQFTYSGEGTIGHVWTSTDTQGSGAWAAPTGGGGDAIESLSGDVSATGPGDVTATLATVNSNVGSFGSASNYTALTVNAKGLVTAASQGAISIGQSQVTNLVSDLSLKAPLASPTFTGSVNIGSTTQITGNVGIGTSAGSGTLRIRANGSSYDSALALYSSNMLQKWQMLPETNGFLYIHKDGLTSIAQTFANSGFVGFGTGSPTAAQVTVGASSNVIQLVVRANPTQTPALQEWQNNSQVMQAKMTKTGDLSANSVQLLSLNAKPTCEAATRGTFYQTYGASSVTDTLEICMKSAADSYNWIPIVTGG